MPNRPEKLIPSASGWDTYYQDLNQDDSKSTYGGFDIKTFQDDDITTYQVELPSGIIERYKLAKIKDVIDQWLETNFWLYTDVMLDTKRLDELYRRRNRIYSYSDSGQMVNYASELKSVLIEISQILKAATEEELSEYNSRF